MESNRHRGFSFPNFVFGALFGLLIVVSALFVKFTFFDSDKKDSPTTISSGLVLSITSPADGEVVNEKNITVTGNSGKASIIVASGATNDEIVEASDGNFSITLNLYEGENFLTFYAFDTGSGESAQTTIEILFLTDEIASANFLVASSHTTASEKAKDRIEKIKQKLATESSSTKKKAAGLDKFHLFGTITSLQSENFTIETKKGNTKTVYFDDLTKFYSIGKGSRKRISFEDLKVGTKVSTIGLSEDDFSGLAKFVLTFDRPTNSRHAVFGKVSKISSKIITLTHIVHTDRIFTIEISSDIVVKNTKEKAVEISNIKVGDVVVAVGETSKQSSLLAKKILVIPQNKGAPSSSTPSAKP